ncbi:hypothetical protein ABIC08_009037, partial [Bradyrhizobium sp. RT9b]
AAFVRIGWPLSIGIGGRLPSESVAALPRIPHRFRPALSATTVTENWNAI